MATRYCRPSDIITDQATTISLTAGGTASAAFPLTNLSDRLAHTVFKNTNTACTIRFQFAVPKTIEAIAIIHHKLAGATVTATNVAGFSQVIAIPANSEDGHCIDAWKSFIGLANPTSDDWSLAITGAATVVAIGEVLLVQTLRTWNFERRSIEGEEHPAIVQESDYRVRRKYSMGVRVREKAGTLTLNTSALRADAVSLERDAQGAARSFLMVPDDSVNDALYVELATKLGLDRLSPGATQVPIRVLEQGKGLAL